MKKCMYCGALQDNRNIYCIDCNTKLGEPLSKNEEISNNIISENSTSEASDDTDYFNVTKLDKVIFLLLLIFAFLHFLLIRIKADYLRENGIIMIGFCSMITAAATAIDLIIPEINWELFKLKFRFSIRNADDMEPSRAYLLSRKYGSKIVLILVIITFIFLLIASIRAGAT